MTRSVFRVCKSCGDLHDLSKWPDNHREWVPDRRSDLAAPSVISDSLEGVGGLNGLQSMADGRWYTSKARMRAEYRAHGVTEMGNDKPPPFKKKRVSKADVRPAIERAFSRAGLGAR